MKKHVFSIGEFAYLAPKGEIVRIIGNTVKEGMFRDKVYIRVGSLKDLNPVDQTFTKYYACDPQTLRPILDKDVQFFFKMTYFTEKFNLLRQL